MEIEIRCRSCRELFDGHPLGLKHKCPKCKSEDTKIVFTDEHWAEEE